MNRTLHLKSMHINPILCILLFFSFITLSPFTVFSSELSKNEKVDIVAEKLQYNKAQDSLVAEGKVKLTYGETEIEAENLTYYQAEQRVFVNGGFTLRTKGDVISGDEIEFNITNSTGNMSGARIFIEKDNFYISGKHIQKVGENEYSIRGAAFTSCDGDSPSWIIKASKVDVEVGEYLFADHARLYMKGVPVFYTPLFIAPVKTERQTGLLTPKMGYSNRYGFIYSQPLYLALAKDKDATINFKHKGNRAYGADLEYRYVRSVDSSGTLNIQHNKEKPPLTGGDRWWGNFKHTENFSSSLYGKVDISAVSDRDYFIDYGDNVDSYSQQRLESKASLVKNWSNYSLLTEFRYQENLIVEEETTLQRMPELTFTAKRQQLRDSPFYFQGISKLTNFKREKDDVAAGLVSGQRLDIHPSISAPLTPGNFFELTPKLGVRGTLYHNNSETNYRESRQIYDLNVDFLMPFNRIYSTGGDEIKKLKHTVEPGFTYTYIPDVDQTQLPSYDGIDRIGETKKVRFLLNNYMTTKRITDEDDIAYNRLIDLKTFRDYNFIEAERELTSSTDERKPWGPITNKLTLKGENDFRLESEVRYDTYKHKKTYLSTDLTGKYKWLSELKLSYRFTADPDVEYFDGTVKISPFDMLDLAYKTRYSITDKIHLESLYGALFTRKCWSLALTYSKRLITEEESLFEERYFVELSLTGLGELGERGELL